VFQKGLAVFVVLLATIATAHAASPSVDPVLCRQLVKHTPAPDVAYKAGVDIHGKKVAPADLDSNATMQIQNPITIPLTADLLTFLNIPASNFPFNKMGRTDINLGVLTVDGDRVSYNGQPLSGEQQDKLVALCSQKP
jgi:hypothetical protein